MAGAIEPTTVSQHEFDAYASDYAAQLGAGLSLTGEDMSYYARARARWVAGRLARMASRPRNVLDFGCGTGSATPYLIDEIGVERVLGVDVSAASVRVAEERFGGERASFAKIGAGTIAPASFDLAFCNGVFHHIPPRQREESARYVLETLRPGGVLAFWENNPWNPGTRLVMSRVAFDRDAVTLTPPESRALLRRVGFDVMRTDFLFIFPAAMRWLRWIEPRAAALPIGGQYLVLCRRPG
jgi:SAM-dependent methyltransferase